MKRSISGKSQSSVSVTVSHPVPYEHSMLILCAALMGSVNILEAVASIFWTDLCVLQGTSGSKSDSFSRKDVRALSLGLVILYLLNPSSCAISSVSTLIRVAILMTSSNALAMGWANPIPLSRLTPTVHNSTTRSPQMIARPREVSWQPLR